MANEVSVEREAIQRAANQLDAAHGVVAGLRTKLESEHSTLMGGWQGQAASAFTNVYQTFDEEMGKVLAAMEQLHQNMLASHTTYVGSEEQVTQTVNRVSGLING
ncbi:MAG: WXG100 family type VII secretion target [Micromonosporaceae bacterium]